MGWICGDGGTEKSNQNRTEGSGWRGYAGMEVQKNQTKIGQKEVGGVGYAGMEVQKNQTKIGQKEVGGGGYAGMEVQKKPK